MPSRFNPGAEINIWRQKLTVNVEPLIKRIKCV